MSDLLTLAQAAKELPNRPSASAVYRWCTSGVRGGVKLQSVFVGGRRYVPRGAIDLFIESCTAAARSEAPPQRTAKQRARAIEAAERGLDALGI